MSSQDEQLIREITFERSKTALRQVFGLMYGAVEYNQDPMQLGRVKVRVVQLHGIAENPVIETGQLPWARTVGGGGWGYGSVKVIPVGTTVAVMFVGGDPEAPFIIGPVPGVPSTPKVHGVKDDLPEHPGAIGEWEGMNRPELPREARLLRHHDPAVQVPFKTAKGATLKIQEDDERERLELVDRTGQGLFIEGTVLVDKNTGNAEQRDQRSVRHGDQTDYTETMVDQSSDMRLVDVAGQGLNISARKNEERVHLISNDASGAKKFPMGDDRQEIIFDAGHSRTILEGYKAGVPIVRIKWDSIRGCLEIDLPDDRGDFRVNGRQATLNVERLVVSGDLEIGGDVLVEGDTEVVGKIRSGENKEEDPREWETDFESVL